MTDVFEAYFRMRRADMPMRTPERLDDPPGFFRFGGVRACFGRLEGLPTAATADSLLADAASAICRDQGHLRLPFSPTETADLLRNEAYVAGNTKKGASGRIGSLVRAAYYAVRPMLPAAVRRQLQRYALADWKTIPFPDWPLDFTLDDLLREILVHVLHARNGERIPFIWFWPDGMRSCAVITHDVEMDAGQRFCPELMTMNEEHGFRGAFQFVPEARYVMRDDVHAAVRNRGHEINLHGLNHDHRLFDDHDEFLRRAARIRDYAQAWDARGFRSPVLYRNQEWFSALEFFDYDMSVPNTARLEAQRGGCCTVMPYFIGNLVELPTTSAEDYTLFHILGDYSTNVWRQQLNATSARNGIFNLLVHPDYLDTRRARYTYRSFLAQMRAQADRDGIWTPLPRDAAAWWRARSRMTIAGNGANLRIEGDLTGRARIAFAQLEDGRLALDRPTSSLVPTGAPG
jgi:peptidoglycan/xylan/chitin deacetylase (PgdA/CDA1 family)